MSVVSTANGSIGGGGGGSVGDDILIHAGRQRLQISVNYHIPSLGSSSGRAWDVDKRLKPELPKKII